MSESDLLLEDYDYDPKIINNINNFNNKIKLCGNHKKVKKFTLITNYNILVKVFNGGNILRL